MKEPNHFHAPAPGGTGKPCMHQKTHNKKRKAGLPLVNLPLHRHLNTGHNRTNIKLANSRTCGCTVETFGPSIQIYISFYLSVTRAYHTRFQMSTDYALIFYILRIAQTLCDSLQESYTQ